MHSQLEMGSRLERLLASGVAAWTREGRPGPLLRALSVAKGGESVLARLELSSWQRILGALVGARLQRPGWPGEVDEAIREGFGLLLRFSRPRGGVATGLAGAESAREAKRLLLALATAFPQTGEARVVGWWYGLGELVHTPPPLPAWASSGGPLASLRADWSRAGDFVVVDHRTAGPGSRLEVFGAGASWLGPDWSVGVDGDCICTKPRVVLWNSSSTADVLEWSWRIGAVRWSRVAILLRGRRQAILADQVEASPRQSLGVVETRLGLPAGVIARPLEGSRGFQLRSAAGRVGAVLPVGLPALSYPTERGGLTAADEVGRLILRQRVEGRRGWLPWLVTWDSGRCRRPVRWRLLTVSQRSRICPPEVASAVRVSWGRNDQLVLYRSLAAAQRRAFLGRQTAARMLVGRFTSKGEIEPLLEVS